MNRIRKSRRIGFGLPGSPLLGRAGPGVGPERPASASRTGAGRLSRALRSSRTSKTSAELKSVSKPKPQPKPQPKAGTTARKASSRKKVV